MQMITIFREAWASMTPTMRALAKVPVLWVGGEAITTALLSLQEGPAYYNLGGRNHIADPNKGGRHEWKNKLRPQSFWSVPLVFGYGALYLGFRKFVTGDTLSKAGMAAFFQTGFKGMDVFVYTRAWGTDKNGCPKKWSDSQCCPGGKSAGLMWAVFRVLEMTFRANVQGADTPFFSFWSWLDTDLPLPFDLTG